MTPEPFKPGTKNCEAAGCKSLVWDQDLRGTPRRVCAINGRIPGNMHMCPAGGPEA